MRKDLVAPLTQSVKRAHLVLILQTQESEETLEGSDLKEGS